MSSHPKSDQWKREITRCHALIVEDDNNICTRVNTVQSFQEANRLITHNLHEFGLASSSSGGGAVSNRRKVLQTKYIMTI